MAQAAAPILDSTNIDQGGEAQRNVALCQEPTS
jgi:hypothetical protein